MMDLMEKQKILKAILRDGTASQLRNMLASGARADFPYPEMGNNTPVHLAAFNKVPDKLQLLLNSLRKDSERLKTALEATNDNGVTPLFEAVWVGRPPYAYAKEENPTPEQLERYKDMFYLNMENMPRTVKVLLDAGANANSAQKAYPGEKGGASYTVMEWLQEQLSWQENIPEEKDPKVRKALEDSLKIIKQHGQEVFISRYNRNTR